MEPACMDHNEAYDMFDRPTCALVGTTELGKE
jgi:hypothetical protein